MGGQNSRVAKTQTLISFVLRVTSTQFFVLIWVPHSFLSFHNKILRIPYAWAKRATKNLLWGVKFKGRQNSNANFFCSTCHINPIFVFIWVPHSFLSFCKKFWRIPDNRAKGATKNLLRGSIFHTADFPHAENFSRIGISSRPPQSTHHSMRLAMLIIMQVIWCENSKYEESYSRKTVFGHFFDRNSGFFDKKN